MSPNPSDSKEAIAIDRIRKHYPRDIIHLGIAMAGAVSAGAYSAGVMHYLLTTLEIWDKIKQHNYSKLAQRIRHGENLDDDQFISAILEAEYELRNEGEWKHVDMHDIRIEMIAGSSAGSLVAAITALSLGYEQEALTFDTMIHEDEANIGSITEIKKCLGNEEGLRNLLFDSWVNLNDGGNIHESVFSKLLKVDAETELQMPFSLLNGSVLDKVRDHQLFKLFENGTKFYKQREIPPYVASDFRILYSLTLLQGIPLSVHFQQFGAQHDDPHPAHRMRRHSYMARFGFQPEENEESELDIFNREKSLEMINAALASGAFPMGLPPRKLLIPPAQLKSFLKVPGLQKSSRIKSEVSDTYPPEQYIVDGGVLNNEPIMEVYDHLMHHVKEEEGVTRKSIKALLLIDPFPNFESEPDVALEGPDSLSKVFSGLLGALRGQGMMKDISALADDTKNKNLFLGMISPSRRNRDGSRVKPAMATSAMEGFAGFIERDFRLHDFYLGMKNAQSFFRSFFKIKPPVADITKESAIARKEYRGLPDLKELETLTKETTTPREHPDTPDEIKSKPPKFGLEKAEPSPAQDQGKSETPERRYGNMEYPRYSLGQLMQLRPLLVKRILFLIRHRLFSANSRKPKATWKMKNLAWQNRIWTWSILLLLAGVLFGLFKALGAQSFWILCLSILILAGWTFFALIQRLANACIQIIGKELQKHKLLE